MRKAVLYSLFRRYGNARKNTAKLRSDEEGREVDMREISIDEVVPTRDVETNRFCDLLNSRVRRDQDRFKVTPELVCQSEILNFDDEAMQLFIDGYLNERDLSLPREDAEELVEVRVGDGMDDGMDDGAMGGGVDGDGEVENMADGIADIAVDGVIADGEGAVDGVIADGDGIRNGDDDVLDDDEEVDHEELRAVLNRIGAAAATSSNVEVVNSISSRRVKLLNALERLTTLRNFHAEHVM